MKRIRLLFLMSFLLFIYSCGSQSSSGGGLTNTVITGKATLSGYVRDSSGTGISEVSVSLTDRVNAKYWSGLTNTKGYYCSGPSGNSREILLGGDIASTFAASKPGYKTYTRQLTISLGGDYHIDVTLEPQ